MEDGRCIQDKEATNPPLPPPCYLTQIQTLPDLRHHALSRRARASRSALQAGWFPEGTRRFDFQRDFQEQNVSQVRGLPVLFIFMYILNFLRGKRSLEVWDPDRKSPLCTLVYLLFIPPLILLPSLDFSSSSYTSSS